MKYTIEVQLSFRLIDKTLNSSQAITIFVNAYYIVNIPFSTPERSITLQMSITILG